MAIVFTPIHPLTGAPLCNLQGTLGATLQVPKEPVISEGRPLYQWFDGLKFQIGDVKVDAFLVPENALGRRPPTMAEIKKILACAKQGTAQGWKAWSRGCVSTGSSYCMGHCDTNATYYGRGLRQFYIGGSVTLYYDTKTGEVVVAPQGKDLFSAAYSWISDNICWIAAGTLVATGAGATVAVAAKSTCDAVRAGMRGGGAPAPGFDPGAGGGNVNPEKEKSWISKHPVAAGGIAVGGIGAVAAVLFSIFRK